MSQSLQLIVLTVSGPLKTHMTSYYQKCAPVLAPVVEEAKHFFFRKPFVVFPAGTKVDLSNDVIEGQGKSILRIVTQMLLQKL